MSDISRNQQYEEKVWAWILKNLYSMVKQLGTSQLSNIEADDIVEETAFYIMECNRSRNNKLSVSKIYEERNTGLLFTVLKDRIDIADGKQYFDTNHIDFFRYKKIHAVCTEYEIDELPENAYIISAILNNSKLSIPVVEQLLIKKKPKLVSYEKYFEASGK